MKKGYMEEVLTFTVIIFSVMILAVFFTSQDTLKEGDVIRSIRGRVNDETANLAIQTLYDNRLEKFNKTYIELMIDAQLDGNNITEIDYGEACSRVNVRNVVDPLFNKYFGEGNWKLVMKTRKGSVTYGGLESESNFKYFSHIPVPSLSLPKKSAGHWSSGEIRTTSTIPHYDATYDEFTKDNIGNVTLYV